MAGVPGVVVVDAGARPAPQVSEYLSSMLAGGRYEPCLDAFVRAGLLRWSWVRVAVEGNA